MDSVTKDRFLHVSYLKYQLWERWQHVDEYLTKKYDKWKNSDVCTFCITVPFSQSRQFIRKSLI